HDHCFKYGATCDGILPDGRPFVDVKSALTKAVNYLPTGETTRMAIEASEGSILGTSPEAKASLLFSVEGAPSATDRVAHIGVKDITLLFTDVKGSTSLYDRIGDLNAFALVQQHFERLQDIATRYRGAIIKTIGDAVMAAFLNPSDAVAAALVMRADIAGFN